MDSLIDHTHVISSLHQGGKPHARGRGWVPADHYYQWVGWAEEEDRDNVQIKDCY